LTDAERGVLLGARRGEACWSRVGPGALRGGHSAEEDFLAGTADTTAPAAGPRSHGATAHDGPGPGWAGQDWNGQDWADEEDLF